jgi:hypothetical protein
MEAKKIILWLYYVAIGMMLIALSFSNFFMSVSQFGLAGIFILDGIRKQEVDDYFRKYKIIVSIPLLIPVGLTWIFKALGRKFKEFFHRENAPAWIFSSIFLLHIIGLFFTTDFHYAMRDLRIKLPILLMPLILSTTCLPDRKGFRFLMYIFTASVFTGTLISTFYFLTHEITDSRTISIFISHIRFSLLIDMAIFILAYLVLKKSDIPRWPKAVMAVIAVWLLVFLFISAFMTGILIFFITLAILIFYMALHKRGLLLKISTIAGVIIFFFLAWLYARNIERDVNHINPVDFNSLDKFTRLGNPYWHNLSGTQVENGNYVYLYIAKDELRQAWNSRSRYDFDGKDKAGQEIESTLMRFLTSKSYRKDAEGVSKLTDQEVALIEDGIASIIYVEKSTLYVRIYKIFWEYTRYEATRNPSGHSVMQRLEFWKTSRAIIKEHWLTGVGTGDLGNAFQEEYEKNGSLLDNEFRWRSHNQFLTIFATFGIIGFAWFIFSLVYPATRLGKFHDFYYLSFFIIIILSMLTEDTLETQAGVTPFAFFTSFYLFAKKFIDIV